MTDDLHYTNLSGNAPESSADTGPKSSDAAVVQDIREKLQKQMVSRLPTKLQGRLEENLPGLQQGLTQALQGTAEFLGPLWGDAKALLSVVARKLATKAAVSSTVGNTFRHLCLVGLNKSELILSGETISVFNDSWSDLAGDNIKRHTVLLFFAPRGLDGKPVNPYLFLMGEGLPDEDDLVDPNAVAMAEQQVGPMALVDLCRISKSEPNTINMLLGADTLFHWDVKDNYVLPTTPTGWVRDVENVLKGYPRTTRAVLYTQWDTDILPPSDRITVRSLRDMPLDDVTWLNKPTLQERYGNHVLMMGIVVAALTYTGLWFQGRQLQSLSDQLAMIEQQIPRGGDFNSLDKAIGEQEKMWRKRDLLPLVTKDTARAIQLSGLKIDQFEVRTPEPEQPPKNYVVTINVKDGVYSGWLQQEPIARSLVLHSALLDAVRKPPTTNGFKLEGIVDASDLEKAYRPFASKLDKTTLGKPGEKPTADAQGTAQGTADKEAN